MEKPGFQHSLMSCQNKVHQTSQRYIPSRFKKRDSNIRKKKKISKYTMGQCGLGTWEGAIERAPALASQSGRHLIFIFNMDILYFWSVCPFLDN